MVKIRINNIMRIDEVVKTEFKVYLDMDGVLADFFGEWARLDGKDHYKDIDNPEAKLQLVRDHPTFWVDLPLLPHARELVRTVKETFGEYYICSTPLAGDSRSESGKRAWINMHFNNMLPSGIELTHNKAQFATNERGVSNILVDDYGKNIASWQMAGGIGIKYEDKNFARVSQTLKRFAKQGELA
jgi:5'(3')-deoxyribonucleotidase